jgi:hypothetical protein
VQVLGQLLSAKKTKMVIEKSSRCHENGGVNGSHPFSSMGSYP